MEEDFLKDDECIPSTPPKGLGLVCGRSRILQDGDLATEKFKLSVDIFGELGLDPKNSGVQSRQTDHIKIQELPKSKYPKHALF